MGKSLIFTDLHGGVDITDKGRSGINTHGSRFEEIVQGIKRVAINGQVSHIMNLGDTGVSGSEKDTEVVDYLREELRAFDVTHLIGNHCLGTSAGDIEGAKQMFGSTSPSKVDIGDIGHITLDLQFGEKSGRAPEETIDWLRRTVESIDLPTVVYGHYPISEDPDNTTYYHKTAPRKAFLENSGIVRDILEGNPLVARYISGHTHKYFEKRIGGIVHTTIPSVSEDRGGKPDGRVGFLDTQTNSLDLVSVL